MEQPEVKEPLAVATASDAKPESLSATKATASTVAPQTCPTCGASAAANNGAAATTPSYIYAIGHVEPRYPTLGIEKEARQATARAGASKDSDRPVMARVLQDANNKYLVRQLCWVLLIQGIEHYILVPQDGDYQPLVDAYRTEPNPGDIELVIGMRGPIASPTMCNGLLVPILIFDQIYAFDRKSLLGAVAKPADAEAKKFNAAAGEMLDRILAQSDNAGATDADRALNYLAVRYDRIYSLAAEQFNQNASLTSINVLPSALSGTRNVVDVVFAFTDRATDVVSKYFVRVDITECYPFLVSKMSPYYDR